MKISKKTIIKKLLKDIFSKLIFSWCTEKLNKLCNDLPFLLEIIKIEKVKELIANLHDKTKYAIYIKNLNQVLNHGSVFKEVDRAIEFNQNPWIKPCIDTNDDLWL